MKRLKVLWAILGLLIAVGCLPQQEKKNVYYVMFEKMPALFDESVYLKGNEIGEIIARESGNLHITMLTISIKSEFLDMMTANAVFYVSNGKLNYAAIENYGEPVPFESKLLGFNSRASIYWFKTKNMLNRSSEAALKRAESLYEMINL